MRRSGDLGATIARFESDIQAVAREVAKNVVARELAARPVPTSRSQSRRPSRNDRGALVARAVSYLLGKPGTGAAELRRVLDVNLSEMRAVISDLIAQRLVRFKGNTRGRVYFATTGVTTKVARSGGRAPAKRHRGDG